MLNLQINVKPETEKKSTESWSRFPTKRYFPRN
jgi:hypothetical protein